MCHRHRTLLQGRSPAICTDVPTVTILGESMVIVVTDYGVAVNPAWRDLLEAMKAAGPAENH